MTREIAISFTTPRELANKLVTKRAEFAAEQGVSYQDVTLQMLDETPGFLRVHLITDKAEAEVAA